MNFPEGYDKLLRYALRIFSKKRYTMSEMEKKLAKYSTKRAEISEDDIKNVIRRMVDLGYLNDEQFVKDYISECIRLRPRGRVLIARDLKFKGVKKELIESGLEETEIDENKIAYELLTKRLKRFKKYPVQEQKMKAYRFLYSRGLNRDAIYKAVERCYDRSG